MFYEFCSFRNFVSFFLQITFVLNLTLSNGCSCICSFPYDVAEAACNYLPNNGLSEVTGIVADTMFKNTVRLRRIVTPGMKLKFLLHLDLCVYYPVTQTD